MSLPERVGKYTVSEVLGRGSMGVVYKGFDPHIARVVAIKTIHKSLLGPADADADAQAALAARFRNEAQAVGRLLHPGIVAIYEYGEDESTAFIAMEFVDGQDLAQVLKHAPLPPMPDVLRLMAELLDALDCAHRHGVWHRDLKPANLLLCRDGRLKLGDFGIARIENQGLTQVSSMIGSPGHMAPEQYVGEGIDQRADLYAAGVLLYRLLTGVQPFVGSAETLMYKTLHEMPQAPSLLRPGVLNSAHDHLLFKALAKAPADRFQSAQEMAQALAEWSAMPPAFDPESTVIVPMPRAAARAPGSTPGAAPTPPGATSLTAITTPPSQWNTAGLSRIERLLAPLVGPMAKVFMRQALRDAPDAPSLINAVSLHVDAAQRQRFVQEALASSQANPLLAPSAVQTGTRATAVTHGSLGGAGPATGLAARTGLPQPISDAEQARALAVMTQQMGPMARVVLKRATERARDHAHWLELLLASTAESDQAALRQALVRPASSPA